MGKVKRQPDIILNKKYDNSDDLFKKVDEAIAKRNQQNANTEIPVKNQLLNSPQTDRGFEFTNVLNQLQTYADNQKQLSQSLGNTEGQVVNSKPLEENSLGDSPYNLTNLLKPMGKPDNNILYPSGQPYNDSIGKFMPKELADYFNANTPNFDTPKVNNPDDISQDQTALLMQGLQNVLEIPAQGIGYIGEGLRNSSNVIKQLTGQRQGNAGLDDLAGAGLDIGRGVLQTGIGLMPQMMGLNAVSPTLVQASRNIATQYDLDPDKAQWVTERALPFLFGTGIGVASLTAEGLSELADVTGATEMFGEKNKEKTKNFLHDVAFFAIASGGKKGVEVWQKNKNDLQGIGDLSEFISKRPQKEGAKDYALYNELKSKAEADGVSAIEYLNSLTKQDRIRYEPLAEYLKPYKIDQFDMLEGMKGNRGYFKPKGRTRKSEKSTYAHSPKETVVTPEMPNEVRTPIRQLESGRLTPKQTMVIIDYLLRKGVPQELIDNAVEISKQPENVPPQTPVKATQEIGATERTAVKENLTTEPEPLQQKQETPKKVETPKQKEAWEMTRGEWKQADPMFTKLHLSRNKIEPDRRIRDPKTEKLATKLSRISGSEGSDIAPTTYYADSRDLHKEIIEKALSEGKPVPEEVLKDYPELKGKEKHTSKPVSLNHILIGSNKKLTESTAKGTFTVLVPRGTSFKEIDGKKIAISGSTSSSTFNIMSQKAKSLGLNPQDYQIYQVVDGNSPNAYAYTYGIDGKTFWKDGTIDRREMPQPTTAKPDKGGNHQVYYNGKVVDMGYILDKKEQSKFGARRIIDNGADYGYIYTPGGVIYKVEQGKRTAKKLSGSEHDIALRQFTVSAKDINEKRSKEGKEESRIATEKLNKKFEDDIAEYERLASIDDRIESKIDRGAKLTKEEMEYYNENQYAPDGYRYDEKGELVEHNTKGVSEEQGQKTETKPQDNKEEPPTEDMHKVEQEEPKGDLAHIQAVASLMLGNQYLKVPDALLTEALRVLGLPNDKEAKTKFISDVAKYYSENPPTKRLPKVLLLGGHDIWKDWDDTKDVETNIISVKVKVTPQKEPVKVLADFVGKNHMRESLRFVYKDAEYGAYVATDGHILYIAKDKTITKTELIDPKSGFAVKVATPYPDYPNVMPNGEPLLVYNANVQELLDKVNGLHTFNDKVVGSTDIDEGKLFVTGKFDLGDRDVSFNPSNLKKVLHAFAKRGVATVKIEYRSPMYGNPRGIRFVAENGDIALMMPMTSANHHWQTVLSMKEDGEVGQKLYKANQSQPTLSKLSPEESKAIEAVYRDVLPNDVKIEYDNTITDTKGEPVRGVADVKNKVIKINPDLANSTTLPHEVAHQMIFIAEPSVSKRALKEFGWDGKGDIPDFANNESLRDAHEDFADAFQEHAKGEFKGTKVQQNLIRYLWNKLKAIFQRMINRLKGKKDPISQKTKQFFEDILSGKTKMEYESRKAKGGKEGKGTLQQEKGELITVHNISPQALQHASKIGGLAMPSLAITKAKFGANGLGGYGEISLIADKKMVDPEEKVKVYERDIYSPTYPETYRYINEKNLDKKMSDIVKGLPDILSENYRFDKAKIEQDLSTGRYTANDLANNKLLQVHFLNSIGELPKPLTRNQRLSHFPEFDGHYEVAQRLAKKYPDLLGGERYTDEYADSVKGFAKDYLDEFYKTLDDDLRDRKDEIWGKLLDRYYANNVSDVKKLLSPVQELDWYKYEYDFVKPLIEKKKSEYEAFLEKEFSDVIGDEYLLDGKTKVPNTLRNALNIMGKAKLKAGEKTLTHGVGKSAAQAAKQFTSISDMRKNKDKIVAENKFKVSQEELKDSFSELADKLYTYYPDKDFSLDRLNNLSKAIGEIAKKGITDNNVSRAISKAGYRGVPSIYYDDVKRVAQKMREMPTEYFEAKLTRGVGLNEFSGAVVPEGTSQKTLDILKENGITNIKYYKIGDESSRAEAISQFDDQLFQIIGEKGAKNLDKAREETIRMDNKNVAEQMETAGKDAKTIRLATGWEKGADGKWRYEIPDGKQFDFAKLHEVPKVTTIGMLPKLSEIYQDDNLYKSYPQLKNVWVGYTKSGKGSFEVLDKYREEYKIGLDRSLSDEELQSALLHEIQHAIQDIEGFAKGGSTGQFEANNRLNKLFKEQQEKFAEDIGFNYWLDETLFNDTNLYKSLLKQGEEDYTLKPIYEEFAKLLPEGDRSYFVNRMLKFDSDINKHKRIDAKEGYRRLAGEVEARNVQTRMNLTPDERRNRTLESTEDIPRSEHIIDFDGASKLYQSANNEEPITKGKSLLIGRSMNNFLNKVQPITTLGKEFTIPPPVYAATNERFNKVYSPADKLMHRYFLEDQSVIVNNDLNKFRDIRALNKNSKESKDFTDKLTAYHADIYKGDYPKGQGVEMIIKDYQFTPKQANVLRQLDKAGKSALELVKQGEKQRLFDYTPSVKDLITEEELQKVLPYQSMGEDIDTLWQQPNTRWAIADYLVENKYSKYGDSFYMNLSRPLKPDYWVVNLKKDDMSDFPYFESRGEALNYIDKMEKDGWTVNQRLVQVKDMSKSVTYFDNLDVSEIMHLMSGEGIDIPDEVINRLITNVRGGSWNKHLIPRKYTPGLKFTPEEIETNVGNLLMESSSNKNRVSGIIKAKIELEDLEKSYDKIIRDPKSTDKEIREIKEILDYAQKFLAGLESGNSKTADAIRGAMYTWDLGFFKPAYLLQQLTENYGLTYPKLMMEVGNAEATKIFAKSHLKVFDVLGNLYLKKLNKPYLKNTDMQLMSVIDRLRNQGVMASLQTLVMGGASQDPSLHYNKGKRTLANVRTLLNVGGVGIDYMTKLQSAVGFYDAAKLKGMTSTDKITEYVAEKLNQTKGDFTKTGTIPALNSRVKSQARNQLVSTLKNLFLTYRKFSTVNTGVWYQALKNKNKMPLVWKALFSLGTAGAFKGFPIIAGAYGIGSLIWNLVSDDDDNSLEYSMQETEQELNKIVEEKTGVPKFGSFIQRGVGTYFGVDMSYLFAQSSTLPTDVLGEKVKNYKSIRELGYNTPNIAFETILGRPVSFVKDVGVGLSSGFNLATQDLPPKERDRAQKDLEKAYPSSIRNYLNKQRLSEDGYKSGNETLIKPENITETEKLLKSLSFTPERFTQARVESQKKSDIEILTKRLDEAKQRARELWETKGDGYSEALRDVYRLQNELKFKKMTDKDYIQEKRDKKFEGYKFPKILR